MTDKQRNRVHYLLNGSWPIVDGWTSGSPRNVEVDPDPEEYARRFPEVLLSVEDPAELHQFALNYNWDDGWGYLDQVVSSPLCDQGTALLIFWLSEPTMFYQPERELEQWEVERHRLIKKIETKYLVEGFASRKIRVDPTDLFGMDYVADSEGEVGFENIPEELKRASPGVAVEPIEF